MPRADRPVDAWTPGSRRQVLDWAGDLKVFADTLGLDPFDMVGRSAVLAAGHESLTGKGHLGGLSFAEEALGVLGDLGSRRVFDSPVPSAVPPPVEMLAEDGSA